MLDALKKRFFNAAKETPEMKKEDAQPELTAEKVPESELAAHLENVKEINLQQAAKLSDALNAITELTSKLAGAQAALAIIEADKASMVAKAVEAKLASRKDKVVEMIGTERADALMTATANMEDAAFDAVLVAMSVATEKEANSAMFKEIGVSGEVDASKVEEEGAVMKALKAKYATAK